MMQKLKILIIEDEQRAGEKLLNSITSISENPEIEWLRSVTEVISFLKTEPELDVVFSDIELLDGNVFRAYEIIQPKCPIIFCTAYNNFYLDAFKTNGIAYLLKPYTEDLFKNAWDKFLLLFKKEKSPISLSLITELKNLLESEKSLYKSIFSVKKRDGIFLLKTNNIVCFQAQGDFVIAIDINNRKHIINDSLTRIENQIDKSIFFRINRSEIINKNSIVKYNQHIKNRLSITLSNYKDILYTSNSRTPDFRIWIEN